MMAHGTTRRRFLRGLLGGGAALLSGFRWPALAEAQEVPAGVRGQRPLVRVTAPDVVDAYGRVDRRPLTEMFHRAVMAITGKHKLDEVVSKYARISDRVGLLVNRAWGLGTSPDFTELVSMWVSWSGIPEDSVIVWDGRPGSYDDAGLARDFLDRSTVIFSLPSLYAHHQLGMSGAVANILGICKDPERYYKTGGLGLGELWNDPEFKAKHKLVIMDALRPYCGPGPAYDPSYRWPQQTLVVSEDPVAVDVVCRDMLIERRNLVKGADWPLAAPADYIEEADTTFGVGTSDPDQIKQSDIWL
jgi:hypothetical protein